MVRQPDPIAVATLGALLVAWGAYGLWQLVSGAGADPGRIVWVATSLPLGAYLVVIGLRSHVIRSRDANPGSAFDPLSADESQPTLAPGHGAALAAGYVSIFTLMATLGLLPMGSIMLYQGDPSALWVLCAGVAAAIASWWLIRRAAKSMG